MKIFDILQQAMRLTDFALKGENPKYIRKHKVKLVSYCLQDFAFAEKWFNVVSSNDFKEILYCRPRLVFKPFRVYISSKWKREKRLKVILDTYKFAKNKIILSKVTIDKNPIKIIDIPINENESISVELGYDDKFRKEGEFVLSLRLSEQNVNLYQASFSFEENSKNQRNCLIGSLQGYKRNTEPDHMKVIQKAMFGLRPKSLMIFLIQEIARNLGCTGLYGVCNKIQAHTQKHFIHIKWIHKLNFDYDKFWEELKGDKNGEGWFKLPLYSERNEMKDIKTHKRALYGKRYELYDQISNKIAINLNE